MSQGMASGRVLPGMRILAVEALVGFAVVADAFRLGTAHTLRVRPAAKTPSIAPKQLSEPF